MCENFDGSWGEEGAGVGGELGGGWGANPNKMIRMNESIHQNANICMLGLQKSFLKNCCPSVAPPSSQRGKWSNKIFTFFMHTARFECTHTHTHCSSQ